MQLEKFRHHTHLTVRFADADILGHVNNAVYHTYLEEARLAYVDTVCHAQQTPIHNMILAKSTVDYLLPLFIGEQIKVHTRCSRLGRKSFDLEYVITNTQNDQIVCTATTTLVGYDYAAQKSVMVADLWRERILAYEHEAPVG